ncbi:hypothetical protein QCA50_020213 [Cerrena zonata]|uniref:Uncharacterized protein n=1 Tax=Cerrena zonata TaxID=2478898 RepID=A0AAW0FAR2_9APHY
MSANVARHANATPAPTRTAYREWNAVGKRQSLTLPIPTPSASPSASDSSVQPDGLSSNASSESSSALPSSEPSSTPSSTPSSQESSSQPPSSQPPSSSPSSTPTSTSSSTPESSSSSSSLPPSSSSSSSSQSLPPSSSVESSSASPPQSLTSAPPTQSSAGSSSAQTTITTTFVTDINGIQQTITSAIPTTIDSAPSSSGGSSQQRAIIAGSVIGGIALLAIVASLILFTKRKNYRRLRVFGQPRSRSMLLAGEDFDDSDPPMTQYRDYPPTPTSGGTLPSRHTPYRDNQQVQFPMASSSANTSPHLATLRASESGSIFREDVWPPPGEASRFVDPILATSSQVNLGGIVEDVMGEHNRRTPSPLPQPRPPSYHLRSGSFGSDPFRATPSPSVHSHQPRNSMIDDSDPALITPPKLFVTNPNSTTSPTSPSPTSKPRNWLERSPTPRVSVIIPDDESHVSMGEAM